MWSLFTEGAAAFGLVGSELPLDENVIRAALDGGVVVASMLPGDFTDTGHFIVIYAYDGQNFRVHDPNSAELSSRTWSYSGPGRADSEFVVACAPLEKHAGSGFVVLIFRLCILKCN